MSYATLDDVAIHISGSIAEEHKMIVFLEQASEEIDALCYGRIRKRGFENLTAFQQEKVKRAVCLHAAFLHSFGEELSCPMTSYGINGVSMSFSTERTVTQSGVTTTNAVMTQLRQSGLASRLIP